MGVVTCLLNRIFVLQQLTGVKKNADIGILFIIFTQGLPMRDYPLPDAASCIKNYLGAGEKNWL